MFQSKAIYNTGVEVINMPEKWQELKFKTYVELVNKDDGDVINRVSILTGLSIEDVSRFKTDLFVQFVNSSLFLGKVEELNDLPIADKWKDFKVGGLEIGKFMQIQNALEECKPQPIYGMVKNDQGVEENGIVDYTPEKNNINAGAKIVKLITGEDIEDKPVTEVLGLVNFFLLKFQSS